MAARNLNLYYDGFRLKSAEMEVHVNHGVVILESNEELIWGHPKKVFILESF